MNTAWGSSHSVAERVWENCLLFSTHVHSQRTEDGSYFAAKFSWNQFIGHTRFSCALEASQVLMTFSIVSSTGGSNNSHNNNNNKQQPFLDRIQTQPPHTRAGTRYTIRWNVNFYCDDDYYYSIFMLFVYCYYFGLTFSMIDIVRCCHRTTKPIHPQAPFSKHTSFPCIIYILSSSRVSFFRYRWISIAIPDSIAYKSQWHKCRTSNVHRGADTR